MDDAEIKREIVKGYVLRSTALYHEKKTPQVWKENILYVEAEMLLFLRPYGNAKRIKGLIECCTRENSLWLFQPNGKDWDEKDLLARLNSTLQAT